MKLWKRVLRGLLGVERPPQVMLAGSLKGAAMATSGRCPVCMEPLANLPSAHQYKIEKDVTYCWTP